VIVAASVSGSIVALAVPVPAPRVLSTPRPDTIVPVTERSFVDERQAQLQVSTGPNRSIVAPRAGRLTALTCRSRDRLSSGTAFATIDGSPVVALATALPLWRELRAGDSGDDVRALQSELSRLGHPVQRDGVVGRATLRAALAVRGMQDSAQVDATVVSPADFAWIPESETVVGECPGVVGAPIALGDVLIDLPLSVVSARLTTIPSPAAEGARVVRLGSTSIPVSRDGTVTDIAGLASIATTSEFLAAGVGASEDSAIPVLWSLEKAISALAVPPSALRGIDGRTACVTPGDENRPVRVTVLGSELGQSIVLTKDGRPLEAVRSVAPKSRSCQ
jgi:peptidoglycan hydrolase-like protein with peptidoglycan-binding domain